jgi:hypothetical protein
MVEVTPMLRLLFSPREASHTGERAAPNPPVAPGIDKLSRRLRQIERERPYLKSVCTSLRDLCEM